MKRTAILLIITAAFLSACTNTKWVRTNVDMQRDFIVTLEQQEEGVIVQQQYEQPYEINLADLEKLMGDLMYTKAVGLTNKKKQNPVFQVVEIERLASVLVDTLAKADANQRIRFTSFNQGKASMFSVPQKTEGVLFVESDGRLNVAFNYINVARQPSETSAIYHNDSRVNPLKIETSDTHILSIDPYADLHKFENGNQAPMWVVVDLKKMKESTIPATVPVIKISEEISPAVVPTTEALGTSVESPAPTQSPEDMLKEDIRNNLKYLKELLDDGLISEKDYDAKKHELLDKIN